MKINSNVSSQKIDKLKAELTTWADLTHPGHLEDDSGNGSEDDEENEILREAGILATSTRRSKHKPTHVIFVSDKAEGLSFVLTSDMAFDKRKQLPSTKLHSLSELLPLPLPKRKRRA